MAARHQPRGEASIALTRVGMVYRTAGGPVEALRDISLDVRRGEFVSLIGPSGCGKSTLLNIVAGLLHQTSGTVLCDGEPVRSGNTKVVYVTQHSTLLPWRTVVNNVAVPLIIQGVPRQERRKRVEAVLALVGLGQF